MPICNSQNCGCALTGGGTISVSGNGTGELPWVVSSAEESAVVELEEAVATLESQMSTALADLTTLESQMANRMKAKFLTAIGDASTVGPTSGGTSLTVLSLVLPDPGVAGRWQVYGQAYFTKTVATDRFAVDLTGLSGGTGGQHGDDGGIDNIQCQSYGVATGSDITVNLRLTRVTGTGTATCQASGARLIAAVFHPDAI